MTLECKKKLIPYSLKQKKPELVLKNAEIVDVFTKRVKQADVAIQEGYIVGVGSFPGEKEVDLSGKYLVPGFLDAHVHIESSMVSPGLFSREVLPHGTTTVIADPHEIVNVAGVEGFRYMLQAARGALITIYYVLPSCVPLNEMDHNGATFGAKDMEEFLSAPEVIGLGEVMNYEAVLKGDTGLLEKIALLAPHVIDGHAPSVTGERFQAYRLAGVCTDHECSTWEQAEERLETGMTVQVREGSAARNLEAIVKGAVASGVGLGRCVFCTDDLHLEDVRRQGHIDHNIRKAVGLGADPIEAIAAATIQAAELYGLQEIGAIAPGYRADLVVLDDLKTVKICGGYKNGVAWEELLKRENPPTPAENAVKQSVHIPEISREQLGIPAEKEFPVIAVIPGEIVTRKEILDLPGKNGWFLPEGDLLKLVAVQRHDGSGRTGVGVLKGFGLHGGAIASTVAHDAHNLIAAGDNDEDILLAIQELSRCQGGYTMVSGGKVLATLPLRIAGLFTDDMGIDVPETLQKIMQLCRKMGIPEGIDPFQNLSFLSLPVIPELRLTDAGLFDVTQNRFIR